MTKRNQRPTAGRRNRPGLVCLAAFFLSVCNLACATTKTATEGEETSAATRPAEKTEKNECVAAQPCFQRAEALVDGDPDAAAEALDFCLACPQPLAATYRLRSELAADTKDFSQALRVVRRGVRDYPQSPELWLARGRYALQGGTVSEALSALRLARELAPNDLAVAEAYHRALSKHGSALEQGRLALEPLIDEAQARLERGDVQGARDALDAALKKVAKVPSLRALVRHRRALVDLSAGSARAAAAGLELAIEEETDPTPLRAEILLAYAEALLRLNRADEAVTAATAATSIAPKEPLAYVNLALAQGRRGHFDEAIAAWRVAFDNGLSQQMSAEQVGAVSGEVRNHAEFVKLLKRAYASP